MVVKAARPFGTQLDDRVVHFNAEAAAHTNNHRFAFHRFEPVLVVLNDVSGDEIDAFRISNECFKRGPFCFELLFARQLFAFRDLFEFLVDLREFACVESEFSDAAFVIDRNSCLVDDPHAGCRRC